MFCFVSNPKIVRLTIIMALLSLSSCASNEQFIWLKNGTQPSPQIYYKDESECTDIAVIQMARAKEMESSSSFQRSLSTQTPARSSAEAMARRSQEEIQNIGATWDLTESCLHGLGYSKVRIKNKKDSEK